jgi:hypothetical protein
VKKLQARSQEPLQNRYSVKKEIENTKNLMPQRTINPSGFLLKRWFSLSEAAIYTGFKEITLRKAVYARELDVGQSGPRGKWYFDVHQLDIWMLRNFGPYQGPCDEKPRAKNGRFLKHDSE